MFSIIQAYYLHKKQLYTQGISPSNQLISFSLFCSISINANHLHSHNLKMLDHLLYVPMGQLCSPLLSKRGNRAYNGLLDVLT